VKLPLREDETVLVETRPHWSILVRPLTTAVIGTSLALAAGFLWSPERGDDPVDLAAGVLAGWFVLRFLLGVLRRRGTAVVLTDRRLISRSGLIGRSVTVVPLDKVGGVSLRRPFAGRLLGYGTVVLHPLWGEGESLLHRIPRPGRFAARVADVLAGSMTEAPVYEPPEDDTEPLPRVIV
jgi:hypothetical protein